MATLPNFHSLVERATRGDRSAQDEIFRSFYPVVRHRVHVSLERDLRVKRPWLASAFSTGDVVQEVFLSVLRDLREVEGRTEAAFAGYLAALVKNRMIDAVRFHEAVRRDVRRSRDSVEPDDLLSANHGPPEEAATVEQREAFLAAIATLSERERQLLRERMDEDTPFARVAATLGYPSADAARKAYYAAQAKVFVRLRSWRSDGARDRR